MNGTKDHISFTDRNDKVFNFLKLYIIYYVTLPKRSTCSKSLSAGTTIIKAITLASKVQYGTQVHQTNYKTRPWIMIQMQCPKWRRWSASMICLNIERCRKQSPPTWYFSLGNSSALHFCSSKYLNFEVLIKPQTTQGRKFEDRQERLIQTIKCITYKHTWNSQNHRK